MAAGTAVSVLALYAAIVQPRAGRVLNFGRIKRALASAPVC
ncbi:hypothetical protein [Streptomyces sp. 8N616]